MLRLAPALELLDRGIVCGGDVDELLSLVKSALGLEGLVADTGWGFSAEPHHLGVPTAWQEAYERRGFLELDQARARLSRVPPGTWFWFERDAPAPAQQNLLDQTLREYFRDVAIVQVGGLPEERIALVLYRPREGRPFDPEDLVAFRTLYTYLRRGLAGAYARRAFRARQHESLDDVLSEADGSAVIRFPAATVEWSQGAKDLWRHQLGVSESHLDRVAEMLVLAAMRAETSDRLEQRLAGGVIVRFVRLPAEGAARTQLLALLNRERRHPLDAPPSAILSPAEALLSPRQRQVARMIAKGASLATVASSLGIGLDTARDHRDDVYRRLGVSTRADVAALLL